MYNLIVLKDRNKYVTSVFDSKNNEIWNNTNYADLVVQDLKRQNFNFNYVLFEDRSLFCVELLGEHDLFDNYRVNLVNIEDFEKDDVYIANEKMGVYGQARYLHRMFLKQKSMVASK